MESLKRCAHIISNNQADITLDLGGDFPRTILYIVPQRPKQTKVLPTELVQCGFREK